MCFNCLPKDESVVLQLYYSKHALPQTVVRMVSQTAEGVQI